MRLIETGGGCETNLSICVSRLYRLRVGGRDGLGANDRSDQWHREGSERCRSAGRRGWRDSNGDGSKENYGHERNRQLRSGESANWTVYARRKSTGLQVVRAERNCPSDRRKS